MRPSSSPGHSTDAPFTTTAAAASAATATATAREPSPVNQQPPVKARTTEAVVEGRLPSPRKRRPSHHPDPDPDDASAAQDQQLSTAPDDQRSKKRRTGPGARGVANLTPEQLAKKRANDREAQRAIRERTKNQIENLEKRIRDLTSQQPYQELQKIIRAKEAVEAENAEMRSRLASIMSLIQPILTPLQGVFASPVPTYPLQSAQPPRSAHSTHNVSTPGSVQSPGSAEESASWHTATGQAQPSPKPNHFKSLNQQRNELVHNLELGSGEQLKLDFLLDPSHRVNRIQTAVNGAQDSPSFQQLPLKHDWAATTYPPPRSSSVLSNSSQHHPHAQVTYMSQHMSHNPEASWAGSPAPIQNSEPTCPLDSLLLDFLHERRQRAAEGMPIQEIVGPRYPSISSLLNPSTGAHPLSKVFTDILATFPGICTLPERIAVLYVMFLIMRWQISPTRENYELLPPWARPLPSQLRSPHPAWVDHLPFPSLRDKIAREYNPGEYLFENFFIPFTSTISLNWPYEPTDALLETPDGSELLINPVFERHLRRLENWTLGDAFDKAFPMLRGTYNYKADGSAGGSRSGSRGGSTAGGQSADDEIHGR